MDSLLVSIDSLVVAVISPNHDIVDSEQVGGNPAAIYPALARLTGP